MVAYSLHVLFFMIMKANVSLCSEYTVEHVNEHLCFSIACKHERHLCDYYMSFIATVVVHPL